MPSVLYIKPCLRHQALLVKDGGWHIIAILCESLQEEAARAAVSAMPAVTVPT